MLCGYNIPPIFVALLKLLTRLFIGAKIRIFIQFPKNLYTIVTLSSNMGENQYVGRIVPHDSVLRVTNALKALNLRLPPIPSQVTNDFEGMRFPPDGELKVIGEMGTVQLNAERGRSLFSERCIAAYDESVVKYMILEGSQFVTTHSLVVVGDEDYIPFVMLTVHFYTRSSTLAARSPQITLTEDIEKASKSDLIMDKIAFLLEQAPDNSILLVDGPIVGGSFHYRIVLDAISQLESRNIIPIFIVKNSNTSIVTENIPQLQKKYNSDLHWSHDILKPGWRTSYFEHRDKHSAGQRFAKVLCYLQPFSGSPQRIEIPYSTYSKYKPSIDKVMDLIYYLIIAQGDEKDSQPRPIKIAEIFAREILHNYPNHSIMAEAVVTDTMNQGRGFAW